MCWHRFEAFLQDALVNLSFKLRLRLQYISLLVIHRTLYGKLDFMSKDEIDDVFEGKKAAAPAVVKKQAKGTGFVESDSDEDEEKQKPKAKKSKK